MSLKSNQDSLIAKAWNWYIGGFKGRPDLPLYRSPRFIRLVVTALLLNGIITTLGADRTTSISSATPLSSQSNPSYVLTESEAYQKCRNHFSNRLDLPYNSPIYTLDASLSSLVVQEGNVNGGKVTQLGNGLTVVAGQVLIEHDESGIKTRHFTCGLNTSDGSFAYFTRGNDNLWQ